jgi:arsenate reductase
MRLTFFHYPKCSSCIKTKKYLLQRGHDLDEIDLTIDPPTPSTLSDLIRKSGRPYTDFLNRSGLQYRSEGMKEKVARLSEAEIIRILSAKGRLIKRPIVTDGERVTVGFQEATFARFW